MITNKKEYIKYLKEDYKALNIQRPNNIQAKLGELIFSNPIWKFQRTLRKLEYYHNCKKSLISKVFKIFILYKYHKLSQRLSFNIPINTCGYGLSIAHYGPIVINTKAKLGNNCRIHVGVNIGEKNGKAPTIGNNCYLGPGAKLFGNIVLGDNIKIGANAVVNKSFIQSNISLAGIPAKIIS